MRDLSDHIRTTTAAISADPTKSYQPSVQMQKSVAVRYSYNVAVVGDRHNLLREVAYRTSLCSCHVPVSVYIDR